MAAITITKKITGSGLGVSAAANIAVNTSGGFLTVGGSLPSSSLLSWNSDTGLNRVAVGNIGIIGNTSGYYGKLTSGSITLQVINPPTSLTFVPTGTGGGSTYVYNVEAIQADGSSSIYAIYGAATGNATLSVTNYNALSWTASTTSIGSIFYNIYRTTGGSTTGLIGTTSSTSFNDTGIVATAGTATNTNNTGSISGSQLTLGDSTAVTASGIPTGLLNYGNQLIYNGLSNSPSTSYVSLSSYPGNINFYNSGATSSLSSPAAMATTTPLGRINFYGYTGSSYVNTAYVSAQTNQAFTTSHGSTALIFATTPSNSVTVAGSAGVAPSSGFFTGSSNSVIDFGQPGLFICSPSGFISFGNGGSSFAGLYANGTGILYATGSVAATSRYGAFSAGSYTTTSLANATTAPTLVTVGTAGSTTYTYKYAWCASDGSYFTVASSTGTITTGNATLSGTNYITITLPTLPTNASSAYVWRVTGGTTQGLIGHTGSTLNDTGLTGDGTTAPTTNGTGGFYASGNIVSTTAGFGLQLKGGSNAKIGTGTLSGGTVNIATTAVTANSLIFITDTNSSTTNVGSLTVSSQTSGTGFTVTSTNASDSSTFNWLIIEKN